MSKPPKLDLKALIAADVAPAMRSEPLPTAVEEPAPPVVEQPAAAAPPAAVVAPAAPVQLHPHRAAEPARGRRPQPAKPEPGRGTIRERARQLSLYLEDPVYDQIREIAHVERVKMHQLVLEGIDLLLKKRGAPSIKDLMKKAG